MLNPVNVTMEDILMESEDFANAEIPERRILLYPWLLEETITLVSGARGCGKSWFGFSILDAVTKGLPFGPWPAPNPVPCFYLDGEMHISDTQARLKHLGTQDRKAPLYVYSDALASLYGVQSSSLLRPEWRRSIEDLLVSHKVKLFAIDNIASLSPGIDENTKQAWDPVNQWLLRLRFRGIATILFHHLSKGGTQRGTSAREDNLDVSIQLNLPPNYNAQDGCRFHALFTKRRTVCDTDSHLIEPMEFLLQSQDGHATWTVSNFAEKNESTIIQMLSEGYRQTDIATTLSMDNGQLSRMVRKLCQKGRIERSVIQKYKRKQDLSEDSSFLEKVFD